MRDVVDVHVWALHCVAFCLCRLFVCVALCGVLNVCASPLVNAFCVREHFGLRCFCLCLTYEGVFLLCNDVSSHCASCIPHPPAHSRSTMATARAMHAPSKEAPSTVEAPAPTRRRRRRPRPRHVRCTPRQHRRLRNRRRRRRVDAGADAPAALAARAADTAVSETADAHPASTHMPMPPTPNPPTRTPLSLHAQPTPP